jgi:hypothetical protein
MAAPSFFIIATEIGSSTVQQFFANGAILKSVVSISALMD